MLGAQSMAELAARAGIALSGNAADVCVLTEQAVCWGPRLWQSWLHALALPDLDMQQTPVVLTEQAVCWGPKAWQSWLHALAVVLLVPCLNVFGGLTIAHAYLAATGQTTYELVKGARVGTTSTCGLPGPICMANMVLFVLFLSSSVRLSEIPWASGMCNSPVPIILASSAQLFCCNMVSV